MKGVNPAWANLPRRKCDDCGKSYKPKQPLRTGQRGFCSDNCRKSYHKHGGAYRKLKREVEKLVFRELARRTQVEAPCEYCRGKGHVTIPTEDNPRKTISTSCPKCVNGAVMTSYGRDVLDFVQRRSAAFLAANPPPRA